MSLKIKSINRESWRAVEMLSVEEGQKGYIEPNSYSLAQSHFEPEWISVALYDEEILIGYAMYGHELDSKRVWIDRFMIDKNHQGKGYGKGFIEVLLDEIREVYNCSEVRLSTHYNNTAAQEFYKKFGFTINGEVDSNEQVMIKYFN